MIFPSSAIKLLLARPPAFFFERQRRSADVVRQARRQVARSGRRAHLRAAPRRQAQVPAQGARGRGRTGERPAGDEPARASVERADRRGGASGTCRAAGARASRRRGREPVPPSVGILQTQITIHTAGRANVAQIRAQDHVAFLIRAVCETTKGKVFAEKILEKLNIFPELVFGYESGTKVEIASKLSNEYEIMGFIEDRKKTLVDIKQNNQTKNIPCYLADWGYLKKTDKNNLPYEIKLLKLKDLEQLVAF